MEKIIPKLVLSDNTEIYKQEDIIKEAQVFYSNLYKEKKVNSRKLSFNVSQTILKMLAVS